MRQNHFTPEVDYTQIADFANLLVQAMLGYSIDEIPEDLRQSTVQKCLDMFSDYIVDFVSSKYGSKSSLRLQAAQKYGSNNVFETFPDLNKKFQEAWVSFFETTSQSWSK